MRPSIFGMPSAESAHSVAAAHEDYAASSLLGVLWRRKLAVIAGTVVAGAAALLFIKTATPVYQATARLRVDEAAPKVLNEGSQPLSRSDTYVNTQAASLQATAVLKRALHDTHADRMKTFADANGNPLEWLLQSGALNIEVARKTDVIEVSMESPYPREAADLADGIVNAYLALEAERVRDTGLTMIASLKKERKTLTETREQCVRQMLAYQRDHNSVSFGDDRANLTRERVTSLAQVLTQAQVEAMNLRAKRDAVRLALKDPKALSVFVESLKSASRDWGNNEYDELKRQEAQFVVALSTSSGTSGPNNPRIQQINFALDSLRSQIRMKEEQIAQGHLVSIEAELAAAEDKAKQLQSAVTEQRQEMLDLADVTVSYNKLSAEADRLQAQCQLLDSRIAEISVNSLQTKPASLDFMEPAPVPTKPLKPNKPLIMIVALMLGSMLGVGLAFVREWRDRCVRTPGEIVPLLGTQLLSMIPRINGQLTPSARGQLVQIDPRSPAAEAFRDIRTSLQLGRMRHAKTILFTSPASADGKSTTVSNVAIAFARSGERTLIIDCDLRHSVQHQIFEVSNHFGLSDLLAEDGDAIEAVQQTSIPNLSILPAGAAPDSPSELLGGSRFPRLLEALGEQFDRIILDSSPIAGVTDGRIIAANVDMTLLVLRMKQSVRELGLWAIDALHKVSANIVGVVANDVPSRHAYSYYTGSWDQPMLRHLQYERNALAENSVLSGFIVPSSAAQAPAGAPNGHHTGATPTPAPSGDVYVDIAPPGPGAPWQKEPVVTTHNGNQGKGHAANGHANGHTANGHSTRPRRTK